MINKLNKKLEEIRNQKQHTQEQYEAVTKQLEQIRNNYVALDGAEQVLLQLISEVETQVEETVE
jgi:predicted  nucleic acid-binding Zn-ribbon protein